MTNAFDHWRADELVQWRLYFSGERGAAPEGRTLASARRRFNIPAFTNLRTTETHVMAVAAARFLPRIPYQGVGTHTKFIEDVQKRALNPESLPRIEWPADVFQEATQAARRALYLVCNEDSKPVDNATSTD